MRNAVAALAPLARVRGLRPDRHSAPGCEESPGQAPVADMPPSTVKTAPLV
jgi:hypothetical protein